MRKLSYIFLLISLNFIFSNTAFAQIDSITNLCSEYLQPPYISDGQQYSALLNRDEVAEFHATFYGGSTYRIVGFCGLQKGNLEITVYDEERNVLFTNTDYNNIPYWDFKFNSTINCIIEAKIDSKNITSGIAVLLIGFIQ
ncbi:MAG: hypothetical protein DRJ01_02435 [Bacteroidetes bacterium]|nr:MAG: hypothetical protein DRJ01_02435 [Bacteroidota bacterium]